MTYSYLTACVFACFVLSQPTPSVPPSLESIAALQLKTEAIFDTLSYTAVSKSATMEVFSPELFRQTIVYKVSRRGSSILLTHDQSHRITAIEQRVGGKVVDPIYEVEETPVSRRILITDDFSLSWPDLRTPWLQIKYASDWANVPHGYKGRLLDYGSGGDLGGLCFGHGSPFHELLRLSSEFSSWEVTTQSDGALEVKRTIIVTPEKKRQDLTLLLDAESGLLRKATFNSGANGESYCAVEYRDIPYRGGTLTVPESYVSKSTDEKGAVTGEVEITFSDFRDESELPAFGIGDIGVVEGAEFYSPLYPSGAMSFKWEGGTLKPSNTPVLGNPKVR